jgi:HAMP domain-containing protein
MAACCTVGAMLGGAGRLVLRRWVLARSGALHARMHFDQGMLSSLSTDRPLHAHPAARACPRVRARGEQHLLQYTETR